MIKSWCLGKTAFPAQERIDVIKVFGIHIFTEFDIGYRIKKNQDYGTELALGNSVMLTGSAIPRIIKTGGRSPVPIVLGATGALATWYYQKKVREFRYGV